MIMFLPLQHCCKQLNWLKHKISKAHIVKGIYPGYNMENDHPISLIHGGVGWNLFINYNCDEQLIKDTLYCILKNKNTFLFNMATCHEYEIILKEKLDK